MGYGTGAIMAVPCGDQRDFEFARTFGLPIPAIQQPPDRGSRPRHRADARHRDVADAFVGDAPYVNSRQRRRSTSTASPTIADGNAADQRLAARPTAHGDGDRHLQAARLAVQPPALLGRAVPDRLRRRRPARTRCPTTSCRWCCPRPTSFSPRTFDPDDEFSNPESPLDRLDDWVDVELDLGDGPQRYRRDTNVMPQWAGIVLVRAALPRPDQRERASSTPRSSSTGWARRPTSGPTIRAASTCTSAASSTPCCTCCTPASGTRCCSTSAT